MKYIQPLNEPVDSTYRNGNAETGTQGSIIPAQAIEHPMREITHLIKQAHAQEQGKTITRAGDVMGAPDAEDLTQLYQAIRKLSCPAGQIMAWGGSTNNVPVGYLACVGQAISRIDYADLYAVLGTTHGIGDGSTSFNLPDLQDRFVIGRSASKEVADSGGSFSHTLTIDEMPAHRHTLVGGGSSRSNSDLNYSNEVIAEHGKRTYTTNGQYDLASTGNSNHEPSKGKSSSTGGSQAHDITNPYYSMIYMIRS